jgi:hypothetical protein
MPPKQVAFFIVFRTGKSLLAAKTNPNWFLSTTLSYGQSVSVHPDKQ